MDIETLIQEMTDQQAYQLLQKAERHAATPPEPAWSQKEGAWKRAQAAGVMDGTGPERYLKRDELAAVLGRRAPAVTAHQDTAAKPLEVGKDT